MSRIKILTIIVVTAIMLFLISGCTTTGNQNDTDDEPYGITEIILDDAPINEISSYDRAQGEYSQTALSAPELWPLRDVEISDFGRQVAEEFLEQFESLFVMRHLWTDEEGIFWWGDSDVWIDRFGNEVVADEVLFITWGNMIASYFQLFDLNYDGIPEIVITFVRSTTHRTFFFKFIDGEYREITSDISPFRFLYNQYGNLLLSTGAGGFQYFNFDDEFNCAFINPDWSNWSSWDDWDWGVYGLIEILPLTDLEKAIRESITERLFAELHIIEDWVKNIPCSDVSFRVAGEGATGFVIDDDILQVDDMALENKIEVNISEPREDEAVVTWQEAYAALLRYYYEQYDGEYILHFLLHDIDMDGIPELFISEQGDWTDHIDVVYTFRDSKAVFLEFGEDVGFMPHLFSASGPYLTPNHGNAPGVIARIRSHGIYMAKLIVIDEDKLVVKYDGEWFVDRDALHRLAVSGNEIDDDALVEKYTTITINGYIVSEGEFNRVFGHFNEYPRMQANRITEVNIQKIIFGR